MKQLFFDLLDYEIPDSVALFAEVTIPDIPTISSPSDIESAIIAQGKLAANLNTILQAFVGLAPVELLLRNGGRNPLLKALVAASYELFGELSVERISVLRITIVRIKDRVSGLVGSGGLSQDDRTSLTLDRQKIAGQANSQALSDEQKTITVKIAEAIDAVIGAADENFDAACDYLVQTIEAALSVFGG